MPSEFQGPHRELLEAPDRDNCPGARPVLAYRSEMNRLALLGEPAVTGADRFRKEREAVGRIWNRELGARS